MPAPKYQQIFDDIKMKIVRGEYKPGTKLPGVVSMSQQYDVSRITSNRVLQELENAGYAERRERVGTFVLNRPSALNELFVFATPEYQRSEHLFEYWRGIVERAEASGISTQLVHVGDPRLELTVRSDQFVGQAVIFLENQQSSVAASLKRSGIPYLFLGIRPSTRDHFVNEDRKGATRDLVERMLRDGRRRIAFLGDLSALNHREARSGYLEAIAETGIGHGLIRDVDDTNVGTIVHEVTSPPYDADALVIVGSHLPIAALPSIVGAQTAPVPGFLFGSRRLLSLNVNGYVAFYDHRVTGALAVDVLQQMVSNQAPVARGNYTDYVLYAPGEYAATGAST